MFSPDKFDAVENLKLELDGHYHLNVPAFYNFNSHANRPIDFIFDTGAFITIISRDSAALLGYLDRFTVQEGIILSGFSGSCLADLKEIPGFAVGGRRIEGVKVAIPHIETDVSILGLNVIEYFKYYNDTECDKIYFSQNPYPDIPEYLQARGIHAISAV